MPEGTPLEFIRMECLQKQPAKQVLVQALVQEQVLVQERSNPDGLVLPGGFIRERQTVAETTDCGVGAGACCAAAGPASAPASSFLHAPSAQATATASATGAKPRRILLIADIREFPV